MLVDTIEIVTTTDGDGVPSPDQVLEAAKGKYRKVIVIGLPLGDSDDPDVCSSHSITDAIKMLGHAAHKLLTLAGML